MSSIHDRVNELSEKIGCTPTIFRFLIIACIIAVVLIVTFILCNHSRVPKTLFVFSILFSVGISLVIWEGMKKTDERKEIKSISGVAIISVTIIGFLGMFVTAIMKYPSTLLVSDHDHMEIKTEQ